MSEKLEVSFNSPQCGWMSVGFSIGGREFHTTTAHSPHENALSDLLKILADLLESVEDFETTLTWNRDPEAYDFVFKRIDDATRLEIFEYPSEERDKNNLERAFAHQGKTIEICRAFYETFQQLYDEREADEFEENWRQPFPVVEFERFKQKLNQK